jgi:hypothetical protein
MSLELLGPLRAAVQTNCDIADASHAGELSMCIFLLQMREYFGWQQGLGFDAVLDRGHLGAWLDARERHWRTLEGRPFEPLPVGGQRHDPFDLAAVNARLRPHGLVYGAGLAGPGRPAFFLAELRGVGTPLEGLVVQHCGHEHARGLFAPPAALQGGDTIVLRHESLARWLWERYEAFSLKRAEGPFGAVARAHGLVDTPAFIAALPGLAAELADTLLLHELGEHRASAWLDPRWTALRMAARDARTSLALRAVRDHIADLTVTLPVLLDRGQATPVHFWFANYEGLRAELFPGLSDAYAAWREGDQGQALRAACRRGAAHFSDLARELLTLGDPAAVQRRLRQGSAGLA